MDQHLMCVYKIPLRIMDFRLEILILYRELQTSCNLQKFALCTV